MDFQAPFELKRDGELERLVTGGDIELKFAPSEGADAGEIVAYGSIFGELDQGNDIVVKGAFAKSLAKRKKNDVWDIPMFFGHAHSSVPIGIWTDFREDGKGLLAKGKLLLTNSADARQMRDVILAGGGMGTSIGYKTIRCDYRAPDGTEQDEWCPGAVRLLKEVDLRELSFTAMPMCRGAGVTSAKSEAEQEAEAKAAAERAAGEQSAALIRALQGATNSFALQHALTSAARTFRR